MTFWHIKRGRQAKTGNSLHACNPSFYALQEALHIVKEEGMEARIKRHRAPLEA